MSIMPVPGNPAQNIHADSATQLSNQSIQTNVAETKENVQELVSFMKTSVNKSAEVIDNEVLMVTKDQLGQKEKTGPEHRGANIKEANNKSPDEIVEQMSAIMTEEEVNRRKKAEKKKAESSFEEKMAKLGKLEGKIDVKQLNKEEQGIVEKFFENMNKIRTLRRKLKQVEKEEEYLESQLSKIDKDKLKERHKEILEEIKNKKGI